MFHLLLGLPDSLLGAAWPSIYPEFSVPVSYMGGISMIIAAGTIVSSLQSSRLTARFGTGRVTAFSVLLTAAALFGFSISRSYLELCLWAVPSLNNYVALHYASRHMSWLHCMWGVGASLGPAILGLALSGGQSWSMGYRSIAALQILLTAVLFLSLPLWGRAPSAGDQDGPSPAPAARALSLSQIVRIPGAKEVMLTFFCYCALEQTTGLWASSYLVLQWGLSSETAAHFASLFFIGITVGRALSGFLTLKCSDAQMVRLGQGVVLGGLVLLLLPLGERAALPGLILIGLGCAPIYPSIIHATPEHFGPACSQAMIGVQMASAYVGTCLMPPFFGLLANHIGVSLLPGYLLVILALMAASHEGLLRRTAGRPAESAAC